MQQETKNCQNCHQDFVIESDDFAFYEKIKVPAPTFCSLCRFERRCAYRNERKIFWNTSAKSGKRILSLYPKSSNVVIYDEDEWRSDAWDGIDYGREYNFSKSLFEQFYELVKEVPRPARSVEGNTRSDFVANTGFSKDCYLTFNSEKNENCAYTNALSSSKDCFEASHSNHCERSYESFWNSSCYSTHFSSECESCSEMWFSKNCKGCNNCFGCVNLRSKSYCIFNKQYSKEEYEEEIKSFKLDIYSGLEEVKKKVYTFWQQFPVKYIQGLKNVNSTGAYVSHSKNVNNGYLVWEGENLKHVQYLFVPANKDCMDITVWGENNELCYENTTCGLGVFNSRFCAESWTEIKNVEYSMFCRKVSDCFGCAGLKNKQYCILNKQYSKEDYFALRSKIIAHMKELPYIDKKGNIYTYGEFFPIEHSPFGYNTSIAIEHFDITKDVALEQGYSWQESESKEYETTLEKLPDAIGDVQKEICDAVIACKNCKRAYKIIPAELNFLKAEKISLPRMCPDCRHAKRISQRNRNRLYKRICDCSGMKSIRGTYQNTTAHFHGENPCPNTFETSYAPERPEIVYCEVCYNSEIV